MTLSAFYRTQAGQQQQAAEDATLQNVRDRSQRAADAWVVLAERSERADAARTPSSDRPLAGIDEGPAGSV